MILLHFSVGLRIEECIDDAGDSDDYFSLDSCAPTDKKSFLRSCLLKTNSASFYTTSREFMITLSFT